MKLKLILALLLVLAPAVCFGASGDPYLIGQSLVTPSGGTLTNCNGLPIASGVSGLGAGIANWLTTPTSAYLRTTMTDETGTGALVFATSPTLVTPVLGTPTSGTLTNCTGLPLAGVTGTADRAVQTSAGGVLEVSAVTSTELGYLDGVTSAIQTQIDNIGGNVFNVVDYGADGSDSTDDTDAIQAAINAAVLVNGTIYFPSGTYILSDNCGSSCSTAIDDDNYALLLRQYDFRSQVTFKGDGYFSSILFTSDTDITILSVKGRNGPNLKGLQFQGSESGVGGSLLELDVAVGTSTGGTSITILDDSTANFPASLPATFELFNLTDDASCTASRTSSTRLTCSSPLSGSKDWSSGNAYGLFTSISDIAINECFFRYGWTGLRFHNVQTATIFESKIENYNKYGLYQTAEYYGDAGDSSIQSSFFISGSGDAALASDNTGIMIAGGGGMKINNTKIMGNSHKYGIDITIDANCKQSTSIFALTGSSLEGMLDRAIKVENNNASVIYERLIFVGNLLQDGIYLDGVTSAADLDQVVITGNMIWPGFGVGGSEGLVEAYDAHNITISGNTFYKSASDSVCAVKNDGDSTYVIASGNTYSNLFTDATKYCGTVSGENFFPNDVRVKQFVKIGNDTATSSQAILYSDDGAGDSSAFTIYRGGVKKFEISNSTASFYSLIDANTVTFRNLAGDYDLMTINYNTGTNEGDLTVTGDITVDACTGCSDYVFESGYNLLTIDEYGSFIKKNNHLPNVEKKYKSSLIKTAQTLLEKTEEQALYILQLHERLKTLEAKLESLQ